MKTIKSIVLAGIMGLMGLMGGQAWSQCAAPDNLAVDHITGTAVTIRWDCADSTVGGFTLVLTDTATNTTTYHYVEGRKREKVLVGLSERTVYRVDLYTDCGSDMVSIFFATPCSMDGERAIGDGSGTVGVVPVRMASKYSICQQLFTASELVGTDTVLGVKFHMATGTDCTRQVDIYLDTTSRTTYNLSTMEHYLPQDSSNLYFSGEIEFTQGWVTVWLDSAFATVSNTGVVLTVVDNTGTTGGPHNFYRSDTDGYMGIFSYRNTLAYDASDANAISTIPVQYRANIVFLSPCGENDCPSPYISDVEAGTTSVDLAWWDNGGASWTIEYRMASDSAWTTSTAVTTNDSCTIGGLHPATDYMIRVGNLCGVDTAYSEISIATLCPPSYPIPFIEDFEYFGVMDKN